MPTVRLRKAFLNGFILTTLFQVNVPHAQMEEILPAARLLSRATSPTPSDYERAKSAFLRGVHEARLQAKVSFQ